MMTTCRGCLLLLLFVISFAYMTYIMYIYFLVESLAPVQVKSVRRGSTLQRIE